MPQNANNNLPASRLAGGLWAGGIFICLLAGGALLAVFLQAYPAARAILNHIPRDGSLDSFTISVYVGLRPVGLFMGGLFLLLGAGALGFAAWSRRQVARATDWICFELRCLKADARSFWKSFRKALPPVWVWGLVVLITLCAAGIRLALINRPFGHDEAYTFIAFAVRPFSKVISDYHLPNNHIFHTILVHFSYLLFGSSPLAVRLPALLAGIAMIPAAYALGARWYGRAVGAVAAALTAVSPALVGFSTDARGYTIMACLTLLLLLLADYLRVHKNRFGWLLAVFITVTGFYTLPMMLYPFGFAWGWLLFSSWSGDISDQYASHWTMFKYLVVFGLLSAGLTIFLYTPVFIYSGINSVFGNVFVEALSWGDFRVTLPIRLGEAWGTWLEGAPWLGWPAIIGLVLSVVLHWKISRRRVPVLIVAFLWLTLLFLIQRPNPMARVWSYLFTPLTIWTIAGWLGGLRLIAGQRVTAWVAAILVVGVLVAGVMDTYHTYPAMITPGKNEGVAKYLSQNLAEKDAVAIGYPWDVAFWYYAFREGIPQEVYSDQYGRDYRRVYVVVTLSEGQTPVSVLKEKEKNHFSCDQSTLKMVTQIRDDQIYTCTR